MPSWRISYEYENEETPQGLTRFSTSSLEKYNKNINRMIQIVTAANKSTSDSIDKLIDLYSTRLRRPSN